MPLFVCPFSQKQKSSHGLWVYGKMGRGGEVWRAWQCQPSKSRCMQNLSCQGFMVNIRGIMDSWSILVTGPSDSEEITERPARLPYRVDVPRLVLVHSGTE